MSANYALQNENDFRQGNLCRPSTTAGKLLWKEMHHVTLPLDLSTSVFPDGLGMGSSLWGRKKFPLSIVFGCLIHQLNQVSNCTLLLCAQGPLCFN
jgi:hypothetical protein